MVAITSALGGIPCVTVNRGLTAVALWLIPFLTALLLALFTTGAVLAFYLPLIPFLIFTFAAIGWFIGVIESIVAAPLVALGIMHPEGPSEVLGRSEQGFMLILGVFLGRA